MLAGSAAGFPMANKGTLRSRDEIYAAMFAHRVAVEQMPPGTEEDAINVCIQAAADTLAWALQLAEVEVLDTAATNGQQFIDEMELRKRAERQ